MQSQFNVDTVNSQNTTYVLILALPGYSNSITVFFRLADTGRTPWQSTYAQLYDHIDNTQCVTVSRVIFHATAFLALQYRVSLLYKKLTRMKTGNRIPKWRPSVFRNRK